MASKLTEETQTFIVQQLACFKTPSEVAALVNEEYEIEVSRQLVRTYNPLQNHTAAKKWNLIFQETRKRFLETVADIPIANQCYRLNELQGLYTKANAAAKPMLLEQAAKEIGGAFTNRRELTGQGGSPIQVDTRANRQEWAEIQLAQFMKEFSLEREAAIEQMAGLAPTVVQYLGSVG